MNETLASAQSAYGNINNTMMNDQLLADMKAKYGRDISEYLATKKDTPDSEEIRTDISEMAKASNDHEKLSQYLAIKLENEFQNETRDNRVQLARLKNSLSDIKVDIPKEQVEVSTRDFEFIGGTYGKYEFIQDAFEPIEGSKNKFKVYVEYTRNKKINKYINVDLDKGKFFIFEYNGHSKIDYYNSHSRHLGYEVIDHKFETIRNTQLPTRTNNQIQQKEYNKGAEQTIFFDKLGLSLRLKFFRK